MVEQYPHILTATIVSDSYQDDNGDWVPGNTDTLSISCRAEPSGSGRLVQLADGSQVVYNWIVYMPKGTAPLPVAAQVNITWNGDPVASGNILRFSQGQLNCRLWL